MSQPPQRILVPIAVGSDDERARARRTVDLALTVAAPLGASVRFVTVLEPMSVEGGHASCHDTSDVAGAQHTACLEAKRQTAAHCLDAFVEEASGAGVAAEFGLLHGQPDKAVEADSQRWGADLVVLATHRRGGLARLFHPSVAWRVARRLDIPLLLLPEPRA